MNKLSAVGLVCMAGLSVAGQAMAQSAAPATAQAWEVRIVTTPILPAGLVQPGGPGGPTNEGGPKWIDAVLVTLQARVAIRTPGAGQSWNTRNFGVSRVGGPTGNFFISMSDSYTRATGQSIVARDVVPGGVNSDGIVTSTDVNGNALTGTRWQFRQGFNPAGSGGSNTDPQNGIISNSVVAGGGNLSTITNLVQTRTIGYDGTPVGVATITGFDAFGAPILSGAFADVYSFVYTPKRAEHDDWSTLALSTRQANAAGSQTNRDIDVTIDGLGLRYLFNVVQNPTAPGLPNGTAQGSTGVNYPTIRTSFRVPTPGAVAVLGLAGLAAARRRRA